MKSWKSREPQAHIAVIGNKATAFFKRFGGKVLAQQSGSGDVPRLADVIGSVQVMLKAYEEGRIDSFVSGVQQVCQHHETRASDRTTLTFAKSRRNSEKP